MAANAMPVKKRHKKRHFTHKHKNCIIVLSPCMYMYVFMSHSDVVVIPRELPLDLRSKLITSLCYAGAKENTIKVWGYAVTVSLMLSNIL